MGGQSKSQIVGYSHSLYAHFIFGAGVADFVSKIWFRDSDTIAWEGKQDVNDIIAINKPDLFGGKSSQGGVVGNIAFMNGSVDQMPNAYQVGFRGALTPAYRGVMSVIWQDLNIGMNPYLPTWGVEWSRIHKRMSLDGVSDRVQWYDEKAAIPFYGSQTIDDLLTSQHWDYKWFADGDFAHNTGWEGLLIDLSSSDWTTNQDKADVPFTSATVNFPISTVWGSDFNNPTVMWYRWNFTPTKSQNITLDVSALFNCEVWLNGNKLDNFSSPKTITIPKSKLIINQNNVIAIRASGGGMPASPAHYLYRHTDTAFGFVPEDTFIANVTAWAQREGSGNIVTGVRVTYTTGLEGAQLATDFEFDFLNYGSPATHSANYVTQFVPSVAAIPNTITVNPISSEIYDINPVHWLREFKTEPWSSARIDEALLPDDVWGSAADTVYDEGLGVTFFYDGSQSIEAAMAEVCRHIGAETYFDRRTGEFKIKLIRNDYDVETIPSLDESSIIDMSKDDTPIFGQLTTDVVVNYTDTENAFVEASITVQDIALAQQQGKRVTANLDYLGFTSGQVAGRKAQQMLNTLSKPLQKRRFVVRTSAGKDFNKGDVFKFSWERENIVDMVMRITDLNFGNGISNRIMIDAVQDEFAMPTESFIAPPSSDWTPIFSEPTALNDRLIIEAPYLELVQLQGQSIVDLQLSDAPDSSYLIGAAGSQSNATKAMMYDGIATYEQVGVLDFCPTATLNQNIGYLDETFNITGGRILDQITLGTWCQIDSELFRVDAISETSATMGRGCLDTIPALHTTGAKIYFWDNASLTDSTEFVSGNTVNMKLLTINPKGQLSLDDAPVDSITMVGRPARPYNMANLKLNDVYYETSISGDLVLTWANRNRLAQTSATIYDFTDGNITPESGTTYTVKIINGDGSAGYSVAGVTGNTATISAFDLSGCDDIVTLEIYSICNDITSYQKYEIELNNINSSGSLISLNFDDTGDRLLDIAGNTWTNNGANFETTSPITGSGSLKLGNVGSTNTCIYTDSTSSLDISARDWVLQFDFLTNDEELFIVMADANFSGTPQYSWAVGLDLRDAPRTLLFGYGTSDSSGLVPIYFDINASYIAGAKNSAILKRSGTTITAKMNGVQLVTTLNPTGVESSTDGFIESFPASTGILSIGDYKKSDSHSGHFILDNVLLLAQSREIMFYEDGDAMVYEDNNRMVYE